MKKLCKIETTSMTLHLLAMAFMLCDHLWGTNMANGEWLTCIGRIAFPIFAFMIAEGFFRTLSRKKYFLRILAFAVISEIPFNMMMGSRLFYPIHQNVLWAFLIAFALMAWNERVKEKRLWFRILIGALSSIIGLLVGTITMVDFYGTGVLTVLVFYFFRQRKWWSYLGQFLCLFYINCEMLGGLVYEFSLFGLDLSFHQQGFALFALIPIWLYRGNRGSKSVPLQYFYYAFYPLHMLVLGLIRML